MPCNDITDVLRIVIDHDDKITDYSLHKRSCGGAVGEEKLIGKWLIGRLVSDVLDTPLDQFQSLLRTKNDIKEFLAIKHFMIVQAGLSVIIGQESGRVSDYCTLESVEHDHMGTEAVLHVKVDAVIDEIKACSRCCGSKGSFSV
jgi:hypothetical protein